MEGFTRIIWKVGKEKLSRQLTSASRLFAECEYKTVIEGQRQACTEHMSLENMPRLLEKLNRDKLVFTPLRRSGYYQGFAHQHKEVKPGDPYYWFGCITRSVEDGQKFKEADLTGDHLTMGEMLGYPECCSKYFKENFSKNYDPVWLNNNEAPDGNPLANNLLRYFGIRIYSHLSCSPDCEATLKIADERVEIMKKLDSATTGWLLEYLASPMTWDSYHGVVEVDTPNFLGLTHTFPLDKQRVIKWR